MTIDPLAEPRRIALAGDWHMSGRWARKAIKHAIECRADVVVHLGDFGYTFEPAFLRAVDSMGMPVLFVDGNHDDHTWLARQSVGDNGLRQLSPWVWHMPRGFRWAWGGVRFLACGGAYSVDRKWRKLGVSWWAGETISDEDVDRCVAGGPADVLISHDCPTGVLIPGVDDRAGPPAWPADAIAEANIHRRQLRRIVDGVQPRQVWHGHYHVGYRRVVDFGYGPVTVDGLDCDETTLQGNVAIVDLEDLRQAQTVP